MDPSQTTSLSPYKEVKEAVQLGMHILNKIPSPHFLPLSRALAFFSAYKVGIGVGGSLGKGFIISRMPFSASKWSNPVFISIETLDISCIGVEKVSSLIGFMSERSLTDVLAGKVIIGAEYNFASSISKDVSKHNEVLLNSDFCCSSITETGLMVDIGISGIKISIDNEKNQQVYGEQATVHSLLQGMDKIPPMKEMDELSNALVCATQAAYVNCFEASNMDDESTMDDL